MLKIKSAQYPEGDFSDPNVRRVASGLIEINETASQALHKLDQVMATNPNVTMAEILKLLSYELRQIGMMTGRFTSL